MSLPDIPVIALLLGNYETDRALVRDVFRTLKWRLFEADGARPLPAYPEARRVQVIITDSPEWPNMLEELLSMTAAPQLVVTSRVADDCLWSEVLNRGGFDVLPEPFDREELERVVSAAARHYHSLSAYRSTAKASAA